jgi:hypothetical protein
VDRTSADQSPLREHIAGSVEATQARLDEVEAQGYDRVWVPPHLGACPRCKALIENRVLPISDLRTATNDGRNEDKWVPAVPLHPGCRHSVEPYSKEAYEFAQADLRALTDSGLTDAVVDDMFDSSGQLKPEYQNDPRLRAWLDRTDDPA